MEELLMILDYWLTVMIGDAKDLDDPLFFWIIDLLNLLRP